MALRDLYNALPWKRQVSSSPSTNREILAATAATNLAADKVVPFPAPTKRPSTDGKEYGASGTQFFGGFVRTDDANPDMDNFQSAVKIYDKMRRTDAQIRSMLQVLKLPLRGATWQALSADGGDPVDEAIAEFVNHCLFTDDAMESSWDHCLRHILLQLEFGFSLMELVWRVDEEGTYRLKRLAPRLPKTIQQWNVDRNGRLLGVVQYAPVPTSIARPNTPGSSTLVGASRVVTNTNIAGLSAVAPYAFQTNTQYQTLTIPADYLAVFSLDREGDNYEGSSLLRTIFRNYFFKDQAYHLEGVRLDRWGVGIPIAQLSNDHTLTPEDLDELVEILKKVRANERAFLIAPPGVQFDLLPRSTSQTAGSGAMEWINHHDAQIARNVLAGFLTMGQDPHGTLGFGSRLTDMFISSLNGVAQGICADLKHQVAHKLCDLNFDMTKRKYPRITVRDLEQIDLQNLVQALAQFATGGFIQPDDDTENLLRKILQLPALKPEMSREKKAQAQPGTAAAATVAEQVTSGQAKGDIATPEGNVPPSANYMEDVEAKKPQQASLFPNLDETQQPFP